MKTKEISHSARSIGDVIPETLEMINSFISGIDVPIPYWVGTPGCGKTSLIQAACNNITSSGNEIVIPYVTHYGQKPLEEVSGIPDLFDYTDSNGNIFFRENGLPMKGTNWSLPDILTELYQLEANNPGAKIIWILDDFHLSSPPLTELGFEMFTDRKLRGFPIPKSIGFMLCGNPSAKAGNKGNLLSPIGNRCALMKVKMDFKYWVDNYAIPNNVHPAVISFLKRNEQYVYEEEQIGLNAFGSFRSWTRFANVISILTRQKRDDPSRLMYYGNSIVGNEGAREFSNFYNIYSKINTEKIFKTGEMPDIGDSLSSAYINGIACSHEFIHLMHNSNNQNHKRQYTQIMGEVLILIFQKQAPIGMSVLNELVIRQGTMRTVTANVKKYIELKDPEVHSEIMRQIEEI